MKKSFFGFLVVALVCMLSVSAFAVTYTDTNEHWAQKSISRWTDEKVLNGYPDNTFRADQNLARAEYATILIRLFNAEKTDDLSSYNDVEKGAWYYDSLSKAVAMGAMEGYSSKEMKPEASITRQEAMVSLNRILGLEPTKAVSGDSGEKTYTDASEISSWAVDTIKAFTQEGYVIGYEDGTVRPKSNITRAECSKIFDKAFGKVIRESGTYDLADINSSVIVLAKDVTLKNTNNVKKIFVLNNDVKSSLKTDKFDDKNINIINMTKKSSSHSSGGSSSTKTSTLTITLTSASGESGDALYDVKKEGTVTDNTKITVIVDGNKIIDSAEFSSSKFDDLKLSIIKLAKENKDSKKVSGEKLVRTAYEKYYRREDVMSLIEKILKEENATSGDRKILRNIRDSYISRTKTAKQIYNEITSEQKERLENAAINLKFDLAKEILQII